jgi:nitroreductase
MNSRLAPIFTRRSVRRFTGGAVTDAEMRDLLEAAMAAPSACAKDPWHFVVLRGRDALERLAGGLPNGQMLRQADAAIVVCGDPARAHGNLESYLIQDCSAAIENVLLAATLLGLGACWLGVHPRHERVAHVRRCCGVPAGVLPVAAIALGRLAEFPEPRTRFRAEAVHAGRW